MSIALEFLEDHDQELGLAAGQLDDIVVTSQYETSQTGATHIHFRQTIAGLEVANSNININIAADGSVMNVGGGFVTSTAFSPIVPMNATQAVTELADHFDWTLSSTPQTVQQIGGTERVSVMRADEIARGDITVGLQYVPADSTGVELAWKINLQTKDGRHWYDVSVSAADGQILNFADWASNAAYNVYALPKEGPNDGPRTIAINPQDSVASPFGWHDTDGVAGPEFTITSGNNVNAYTDRDNDDVADPGSAPDGGATLTFDFPIDPAQPPSTYSDAAVTNLFYWNNILHDVHYQYGFDEAGGNFQFNNYGRGGLGGDPVEAQAQDGADIGDSDNANMFTPPDGMSPRMQMYEFTATTPRRDSDLDAGVMVHEYGHGVSNRLTGGPADANALQTPESRGMGEGWSDFWTLMFSQQPSDQQGDAYGIGTYVLGEPADGPGIRNYPYSFDLAIDPQTYGDIASTNVPHGVGEIWAAALWDMNWLLINGVPNVVPGHGFSSDLYRGTAGNNIALGLVMNGLKLQPANPTMLEGRDAILLADQALTGGANQIAIWTAFARRGMGFSANDGGDSNNLNVTPAFDLPPRLIPGPGLQLIAVTPNEGDLYEPNRVNVREIGPSELIFRFDANDDLDATTLDGIQITRAGQDGDFEFASASTDFGTNGQVYVEFTAQQLGLGGNDIAVHLSGSDHGMGSDATPIVSVVGKGISVDMNTRAGATSTVQDVVNALNADKAASLLVHANVIAGDASLDIAALDTSVKLHGADAANATTDFNSGVQVTFTAVATGIAGNDVRLKFQSADLGAGAAPAVSVQGTTINVVFNSRPGSETTAQALINAINSHVMASALVRAHLRLGDPNVDITQAVIDYSPLELSGADIRLQPGYRAIGDTSHQVVYRFGSTLPDDLYRIEVFGFDDANRGVTALRNAAGDALNPAVELADRDVIEFDLDLGAQVVAAVPQPVYQPQTITLSGATGGSFQLRFEGHVTGPIPINATADIVQDALEALPIIKTGDVWVAGDGPWHVAFRGRFEGEAVTLLEVDSAGLTGAGATATVEELATLVQARDQIIVYFNNDELDLTLAENPAFYQLHATKESLTNTDDGPIVNPIDVQYSAETNSAVLTFADDLAVIPGPGTHRLRIGTNEARPAAPTVLSPAVDPADTFIAATDVSTDLSATNGLVIRSTIAPQPYDFDFPGASDEPGHRDIPVAGEQHYNPLFTADTTAGMTTIPYNFKTDYGVAPGGAALTNKITPEQRDLARAIFEIYGSFLGVQFYESVSSGITVATGDLRVVGPALPVVAADGTAYTTRIDPTFATSMLVMDDAESFDNAFGSPGTTANPSWFESALIGIAEILGLENAHELSVANFFSNQNVSPAGVPAPEQIFPGAQDALHLQHLYRPDGRDVDLYTFTLDEPGLLTAETFAERLANSSLLDTTLSIYQDVPVFGVGGSFTGFDRQLIARNDDYFSEDSYLELNLDAGTYYVAVSAAGNDQFDPHVANTGLGGLTEGDYELRLQFRPEVTGVNVLRDKDGDGGTAFDGDADGIAGGVFNFWFQTRPLDRALAFGTTGAALADGATITVTSATGATKTYEFDKDSPANLNNASNTRVPYNTGSSSAALAVSLNTAIALSGLNVSSQVVGNSLVLCGERSVTLGPLATGIRVEGKTIFVDKSSGGAADGSLDAPFNKIASAGGAFAVTMNGDIVRIVGNGGDDRDPATLADNRAYEIGFGGPLDAPLQDGSTMNVPQGVTVMIDAGAVFKLRQARIGVGSSTTSVNRSRGALQVLGTPAANVIFTSYNDQSIGVDTNPLATVPSSGDWGGLSFRNDLDRFEGRVDYESQGIFLNYVNQADIRYGGGVIDVDSVSQVINPIHITESRPTVSYNTISDSADSALSADPNSFAETNYHAPPFQTGGAFTLDYDRVGPDLRGNAIFGNSTNGIFVRTETPAGGPLKHLTTAGRFDDRDVVHVIAENLTIEGTPGGPVEETRRLPVNLVQLTAQPVGALPGGSYNYRLTLVDKNGYEAPASAATINRTVTTSTGAIRLSNLPPATGEFVNRRIYRSAPGGAAPYELVAQLGKSETVYVDDNRDTLTGTVDTSITSLRRPRLDARLAVDPGVVMKLEGAMIEATVGSQLLLEGRDGNEIVVTSKLDDRYGAGGSFDTNDDGPMVAGTSSQPAAGNWGGLYIGHTSSASIDNAIIAYGGGEVTLEGDFGAFNVVEIHQADVRIAHSIIEHNEGGTESTGPTDRFGRMTNESAVVFVRGAQPIILDNVIRNNSSTDPVNSPAISIDVNSLTAELRWDTGRETGFIQRTSGYLSNHGPLIRENRFDANEINGLDVRGGELNTEGVWDDTDVVHVLQSLVEVPNYSTVGGLRLASSATESLVVKSLDPTGSVAGINVAGNPLDVRDRVGGQLHVVGQPNSPVVMTSLYDCSIGAGFHLDGTSNVDTVPAFCGTVMTDQSGPEYVDVIVVIDESGTMSGSQMFTEFLIPALEADLLAQGIGAGADPNQYGLVGFGGSSSGGHQLGHAHPVGPAGALFGSATEYVTAAQSLVISGSAEDGYSGIQFALDNYPLRPNAEKFIILVTDEPRSVIDGTLTYASILSGLQAADVNLEGILNVNAFDGAGTVALAVNAAGVAYLDDGMGGIIASPGGVLTPGASVTDYADLVFDTGGLVGDIDLIASGPPITDSFAEAIIAQIIVTVSGGQLASPGDWQGISLQQYSHDRNVELIVENEADDARAPGVNGTPATAQFIGQLAPSEFAGDDNRRLGFEIHGLVGDPGDVDVYSFKGTAGTEIWLDVDSTSNALDSVVELLDANGLILAQSNNSIAEFADPSLLYNDASLLSETVNPLFKAPSAYQLTHASGIVKDTNSTNPFDAGLRVILPGQPGAQSTYHVRVRSSNLAAGDPASKLQDPTQVANGLSAGVYQLQVRLREADELPGSTVRYSDLRFASTAIDVNGLPAHTPLAGEAVEVAGDNQDPGGAQDIGNLLVSDRAVISTAGALSAPGDQDFFAFDVVYDDISPGGGNLFTHAVFDVDYADGLTRPNTNLSVFAPDSGLILIGRDSNIAEDRPGPLPDPSDPGDMFDLSRGSDGPKDPFIGPVALPTGTYQVGVYNDTRMPTALSQFVDAGSMLTGVRLEPLNTVVRIAEDHITTSGGSTFAPPVVPTLFGPGSVLPGATNLWHVTTLRGADPGHGIPAVFDGSRAPEAGDSSFYFGVDATNNFDLGAGTTPRGSLLTNPFSLQGYAPADKPVLYFNYFLDTEDHNAAPFANRDGFRVYAVDANSDAHLLATNNVNTPMRGPGPADDEFDDPNPTDNININVQPLFDNSGAWRQARIELDSFAGMNNLRLRFDFDAMNGMANGGEGVYIDDLIIGFAERGEMVTGAPADVLNFRDNPNAGNDVTQGPYQLEVRRSS